MNIISSKTMNTANQSPMQGAQSNLFATNALNKGGKSQFSQEALNFIHSTKVDSGPSALQ